MVAIDARCVRPRHDHRGDALVDRAFVDRDRQRLAARVDHVADMRMQRAGKHDAAALLAMMPPGDADRLGDRRRLVEQRGRCDRQAGEFGDQRLEMEQQLQPPLADLGLVGRVGRVPGRVLEQVALDHRRHDHAMEAGADEALQHLVRAHLGGELGERRGFARRLRQVERPVEPDRLRHGLRDQRLDRRDAERGEHGALVGKVRADMAIGECGDRVRHDLFLGDVQPISAL